MPDQVVKGLPQRQSLRNLHYALLTEDTKEALSYETPKPLVGAISAKVSPTSNQEKLWADDAIFDIAANLGEVTFETEIVALPIKAQAVLLGHKYENGVMTMTDTDEPPYLAIGFMSMPQPNRFRLVWLYKGKFSLLEDEYATATDAATWRNAKLKATFVKRDHDGQWQVIADSGDDGFAGTADDWFKAVYAPPTATPGSAPTPANGENTPKERK